MEQQTAYTQNYWEGKEYQKSKDLSTVECAKLIRQEIREKFKGIKINVRSEYYSMGSSVNITVKDFGFNPINPEWVKERDKPDFFSNGGENRTPRYTERARNILEQLKEIGNKYNYSDCDGMIDYYNVNYHLSVDFDWEKEAEFIEQLKGVA